MAAPTPPIVGETSAGGEATIVKLSPSTRYVRPTCGEAPGEPMDEADFCLRRIGCDRRLRRGGFSLPDRPAGELADARPTVDARPRDCKMTGLDWKDDERMEDLTSGETALNF